MLGFLGSSDKARSAVLGGNTKSARQLEQLRNQNILLGQDAIDANFARFDDNFFNARKDAYINFAMPQVQEQADAAKKGLIYAAVDRGIGDSTIAERNAAALESEVQKQRRAVMDAAFGQANEARKQVQSQKDMLTSQLATSNDPFLAATNAAATANSISAPSVYQPLSNLFDNFATMYYARELQKPNPYTQIYRYNFAPSGGSTQKGK